MHKQQYLRSAAGFTLIELVIVMVVLAIMAGLAIPKFMDIRAEAKVSAVNGSLGGVRSAIANYKANQVAKSLTPEIPTLLSLTTPGTVMDGAVPDNPYDTTAPKNDVGAATAAKGTVGCAATPLTTAWCYSATTGEFWAATNVAGEKDL